MRQQTRELALASVLGALAVLFLFHILLIKCGCAIYPFIIFTANLIQRINLTLVVWILCCKPDLIPTKYSVLHGRHIVGSKQKLRTPGIQLWILKHGNHIPEQFRMQFRIQFIDDY